MRQDTISDFYQSRHHASQSVGILLRDWRRRRRMSQTDLALHAEMTATQLRFLESGRAQPSRRTLLRLAGHLDIPLHERNTLLTAAGFPAAYRQRSYFETALDLARHNVETMLAAHQPNPALAVDRHWMILSANPAFCRLVAGVDPVLLRAPGNLLRLVLHPAGLAPRIVNLAEWRGSLLTRLRRRIEACDDPALHDLLDELLDYPCPPDSLPEDLATEPASTLVAVPLRLATIEGELTFHNTTTIFGMPMDITVAELSVEAFLPADVGTAALLRRTAQPEAEAAVFA